ncbi:MAG: glycosyltransferase [Clostridia bacterium]|nr:glycosyltransferase [Clostridia bacterium]
MKSLFFLMKYPTCVPETLKRKFNGQMNACMRLGYEAWYLEWDGTGFDLVCRNTGQRRRVMNTTRALPRETYYHTLYFVDMYRAAIRALGMHAFQLMYIRFLPTFPPAVRFVKLAKKRGITLVQEIPTYLGQGNGDGSVQPGLARRVGLRLSNAYARLAQRHVDFFTVIGENAGGRLYGKPAMNIHNGIDVGAIPLRSYQPRQDGLHLLLLASMCDWHGYDRMIDALRRYRGSETITLHFAGNDGDGSLAKWRELAREQGLEDRVCFHGAVYGQELDELVNGMDLGISSLGLYRIGLSVGTVMKGREYMARGLPFVYAGEDPAIAKDHPFALQVPNDDSPIEMEDVAAFALRVRATADAAQRMREYAQQNMSWETEFERILSAVDKGGRL